jgi:hypothetical protein
MSPVSNHSDTHKNASPLFLIIKKATHFLMREVPARWCVCRRGRLAVACFCPHGVDLWLWAQGYESSTADARKPPRGMHAAYTETVSFVGFPRESLGTPGLWMRNWAMGMGTCTTFLGRVQLFVSEVPLQWLYWFPEIQWLPTLLGSACVCSSPLQRLVVCYITPTTTPPPKCLGMWALRAPTGTR